MIADHAWLVTSVLVGCIVLTLVALVKEALP